jgi:hypothetical protein
MKIIFLDFDGVLNRDQDYPPRTSGDKTFCTRGLPLRRDLCYKLDKILDATQAWLVISSSQRYHFKNNLEIQGMLESAGASLARVFSITPSRKHGVSCKEIDLWRIKSRLNIESWVILDDIQQVQKHQEPHFIQTNSRVGLTDDNVNKAINILNGRRVTWRRQELRLPANLSKSSPKGKTVSYICMM